MSVGSYRCVSECRTVKQSDAFVERHHDQRHEETTQVKQDADCSSLQWNRLH